MTTQQTERFGGFESQGEFDQIYQAHSPKIYRLCFRLSMNRDDAEDLTLETFLAAYQSRKTFQGKSTLETWLYSIAINRWRKHCQKNKRRPTSLEGLELAIEGQSIENLAIEQAMAKLASPLKEALMLVKGEGLKYKEVAEILQVPMGTVQYRVFQATEQLQKLFNGESSRGKSPGNGQIRCENEV